MNPANASNGSISAVVIPMVCLFCGRAGHSRRSHRNCGMNAANYSSATDAANISRCASCGGEYHYSRRTYRHCPMNPNNLASTNTAPEQVVEASVRHNPVVCRHCGREGHSRKSHSNCGMNFTTAQNRVSNLNIARDPELPEVQRNNIGAMDVICSKCHAHMWVAERKSSSSISQPEFQTCCAAGKAIILRPLEPYPDVTVDLLRNDSAEANEFKQNIRTYNSALSFTSMNADLNRRYANEQHGAYAFRIHGGVCHLMNSTLIPGENNVIQQPRFAQIYIFDSQNELQN